MDVGGISTSMVSQLYQPTPQINGGQVVQPEQQQAQQAQQQVQQPQQAQQGPSEERSESAVLQARENNTGGEAKESGSIDTYA